MSAVYIPSVLVSPRFLAMLDAPPMTESLSFEITAGGLLQCRATYWTDLRDEMLTKVWEVMLPRTSPFYKLIAGEL